jgi:IS30 family transposase
VKRVCPAGKKGGRPRYVLEKQDRIRIRKMLMAGVPIRNLCSFLGISENTIYNMMKRDKKFLQTVKNGKMDFFLKCTQKAAENKLNSNIYTWFCKTIWQDFFPKETKEQQLPNTPHTVVYYPQSKKNTKRLMR